jgi:hypothetical protein
MVHYANHAGLIQQIAYSVNQRNYKKSIINLTNPILYVILRYNQEKDSL